MKFKYVVPALLLGLASCGAVEPAAAKVFSTSYGSRPSISRSYSAPSRPVPVIRKNVTINRTTVVHQNSGSGLSGIATGVLLGTMLSPHTTIVQQPVPVAPVVAPMIDTQAITAPAPKEENSHTFLYFIFWLALFGVGLGVWAHRDKNKD